MGVGVEEWYTSMLGSDIAFLGIAAVDEESPPQQASLLAAEPPEA